LSNESNLFQTLTLKEKITLVERCLIEEKLSDCNNNKSKASRELGISREALRKKIIISNELIEKINIKHEEGTDMTAKSIEKELSNCVNINDYDVNISKGKDVYVVDISYINPQDSSDMVILLNLKKKIRSVVNRGFRIKFIITFLT